MKRLLIFLIIFFMRINIYAQTDITAVQMMPFVVNVTTAWTEQPIEINVGDTVIIRVEGYASCSYNSETSNWNWYGPEGWGDYSAGDGFPLKSVPASSVIGKIGDSGNPFYVGKNRVFIANTLGKLYLGYNDSMYDDNDGYYYAYVFINPKTLNYPISSVGEGRELFPNTTQLSQNYPNPFNPNTTIKYQISQRGNVEVGIYDLNGRLVKTLLNTDQYPGNYTIQWDGRSNEGITVSSGTYFYQVKSDNVQLVKKMLLLK